MSVHACMCVGVYMHECACVHVCMCVGVCVWVCVCVYMREQSMK